jgi:lactate permease
MWQHNYEPIGGSLSASAAIAAVPIVVLFVMLGVLRKPSWMAALSALGSASAHRPLRVRDAGEAGPDLSDLRRCVRAVSDRVGRVQLDHDVSLAVDTGKFEIIKDSVGSLTDDRRLQAMFIAFSFGAFIEGAAGFGAPVAVSGAMLAGLGFNPFYAAGICLLANTAPVAFGSIGIPGDDARQRDRAAGDALSAMVGGCAR